jgi:hypothetical protein
MLKVEGKENRFHASLYSSAMAPHSHTAPRFHVTTGRPSVYLQYDKESPTMTKHIHAGLFLLLAAAWADAGQGRGPRWRGGRGDDTQATGCGGGCAAAAVASATGTLSEAEAAGLLFMREEETLAYDVYQALGRKWGLPMFDNISAAEQRHMAAVGALIESYRLPDPLKDRQPGTFRNADLQTLHDQLVAAGSESLMAALKAGAEIEELDIKDLQDRIDAAKNPAIRAVYGNLQRASRNHLRAFTGQLESRGGSYEPRHLQRRVYRAILSGDHEPGGGH